jgi:hypothetical protein
MPIKLGHLAIAALIGIVAALGIILSARQSSEEYGFDTLHAAHPYTKQLLLLTDAPVRDDWCYGNENMLPSDFKVADFIIDYISFFSNSNADKYSRFHKCGTKEANVCGIAFGERGTSEENRYSRTLWFEINPDTGLIIPDSFVCTGI